MDFKLDKKVMQVIGTLIIIYASNDGIGNLKNICFLYHLTPYINEKVIDYALCLVDRYICFTYKWFYMVLSS